SEGFDQIVGQPRDEANGVADRRVPPAREIDPTGRRIERGEQLIGHDHVGAGESTHQRRLPGVRIPDDRDLWEVRLLPAGPLDVALFAKVLHIPTELRDPTPDVLPVDLELRLPRTAGPDPASQPAHR